MKVETDINGLVQFREEEIENFKSDYKYLLGGCIEDGVTLYGVRGRRLRGHKHSLQCGKYLLDVRKLIFAVRMFKQ